MKLVCTLCEEPVAAHCHEVACCWVVCTNRDCDARVYDLDRGLLLLADGVVEGMYDR